MIADRIGHATDNQLICLDNQIGVVGVEFEQTDVAVVLQRSARFKRGRAAHANPRIQGLTGGIGFHAEAQHGSRILVIVAGDVDLAARIDAHDGLVPVVHVAPDLHHSVIEKRQRASGPAKTHM